jgi:signal transduction histidine kinase
MSMNSTDAANPALPNPPLDVLRNQPFPELAAALRVRSPRILERWESAVRDLLPSAEELTLGQLRNSLPLIIDQMIEALEAAEPGPTDRLMEVSQPHGETRFHQEYNVNELLVEYHLLRRIILEETTAQLTRDLTPSELIALNLGIDTALRRGVVTFVQHLTRQITASDDLQSHYVSFLNHDLRGGMNGILLMVEVLKREIGSDPKFTEAADDLEAMRRAVFDSVATMDRFVFAYRLGRGRHKARFAPVNVKTLVQDVMTSLASAAKEKAVQITTSIDEGCVLETDRDMLRLIVHNLLGNTVKHAKRGGMTVQLTARRLPDAAGCEFTVSDNGTGIPPEQLPDLFKLSFVPPQGKGKAGVHLGLPVSKMAADIMGATLTVDSTPGAGTTCRLTVPNRKLVT